MTLSYSLNFPNGDPTRFPEKIYSALPHLPVDLIVAETLNKKWFDHERFLEYQPKLHTIRVDESGRWIKGKSIHSVVNNRTKNRFQFLPVMKCRSVQSFEIVRAKDLVKIDDKEFSLSSDIINTLAINDGFRSMHHFYQYFTGDFKGKIIHWTLLKYQ